MAGSRHLPIGSASRFRGFFSQCSPQKLTQCSYSFGIKAVGQPRCRLAMSAFLVEEVRQ